MTQGETPKTQEIFTSLHTRNRIAAALIRVAEIEKKDFNPDALAALRAESGRAIKITHFRGRGRVEIFYCISGVRYSYLFMSLHPWQHFLES